MKQTRTPLNPFLLSGYHSPDYFCDREEETEKLVSRHEGRGGDEKVQIRH